MSLTSKACVSSAIAALFLVTPNLQAQCKSGAQKGGSSTMFGGPGNSKMTSLQLQQRLMLMTSIQQQQRIMLMTSLQQQQQPRTPLLTPVQQPPALQTLLQQQEKQNKFLIAVPQDNPAWVTAQQKHYVAALRTALQQTTALDRALQNQNNLSDQQAWRETLQQQKDELLSLQQQFVQK